MRVIDSRAGWRRSIPRRRRLPSSDQFRTWGELIYAYLWQISRGQTELSVDGVTIPLDPKLSPKDNAKAYFERYRKAQGAASALPDLRDANRA